MTLTLTAPPPEFSARYPGKSPEYLEAAWHYRHGQASTGAVQVAFFGESHAWLVEFPANREVIEKWLTQLK